MGLFEVNEAAEVVTSAADQNANVIFGAVIDALKDEVRVTVIATGFGPGARSRRRATTEEQAPASRPESGRWTSRRTFWKCRRSYATSAGSDRESGRAPDGGDGGLWVSRRPRRPTTNAAVASGGVQTLHRTPLYERHRALGARLVPFAGWEMPVRVPRSVIQEHRAVRGDCGVFDVSHMGELEVEGPKARALLQSLLSNDIDKLEPGEGQYPC